MITITPPYPVKRRRDTGGDSASAAPMEVSNGLVEPSFEIFRQEGLCIVRTLIPAPRKMLVRIINVNNQE